MHRKLFSLFIISLIYFQVTAQYSEKIEPDFIKTIQFSGTTRQSQLPIIKLGEPLFLTFDALNGDEENYYYKITHHDFDWSLSDLSKGEYMDGFDNVRIYDYNNSYNTLQNYSNYQLKIPNNDTRRLTKTGNYMLSIYDNDDELVFSRKFMVIEYLVGVETAIKRARNLKNIETQQVVQFVINTPDLAVVNPDLTMKVMVMQNSDLKTAITDLSPQYTIGSDLIYRYDEEASFDGGNEFLFFDNKDIRGATSSIRFIELTDIYNHYLFTNGARYDRPYTYNPDINGNYEVRVLDSTRDIKVEADYARVHFNLQYFEDLGDREIHLYGNFNNWTIDESTYMEYSPETDSYRNSRLFKQGFYNYKYVVVNRDGSIDQGAIGGNFWQTENEYTVLVYFRKLGGRYDRIVGMGKANSTSINNQ